MCIRDSNRGVLPFFDVLRIAEEAELDLVEVAPNANPPVCRVLDFGKFAYEQTKKAVSYTHLLLGDPGVRSLHSSLVTRHS